MAAADTTKIRQHFTALVDGTRTAEKNERLSILLDNIYIEFQQNPTLQKSSDAISELTNALMAVKDIQWLLQPRLVGHRLFIMVRDHLVDIISNDKLIELVTKIAKLLHDTCFATSVQDEMVQLMLYKPLMDKLNIFLIEFEQYHESSKLLGPMGHLLRTYRRIQMMRIDLFEESLLELLFLNVAKCISSTFMMVQLSRSPKVMTDLNPLQEFLFDHCIDFMYWQPFEESLLRQQTLKRICEVLLPNVTRMISLQSFSEPIMHMINLLCVDVMVSDISTDEQILHQDYFVLLKYCLATIGDGSARLKDSLLLECICHLTNHSDLLAFMKDADSFKLILLKLTECDDVQISFYAYRVLALILREDDIKTMKNANKIVGIFYLYFISMMDDPVQRTAFQSFLRSLRNLIQHDGIKTEVLQQEIVPLLIRCVTERQSFHSIKVLRYTLEIILALSFNDEAANIFIQSSDLQKCLETLKHADDEAIQRATNHLIWRLQQKTSVPNVNQHPTGSASKYDIMISYSHSDKKLCFQICDFLEKDGLHVWIDRDRMHGDAIVAMADAIENSEFIVMCMSDTYKSSPYCQAEANYAFQRQSKILPLVMKSKYKPDGWLGFITSGKIYVDFAKHDFSQACGLLKKEIQNKRQVKTNQPNKLQVVHESVPAIPPPKKPDQPQISVKLPLSVDNWSEDHVRAFLTTNHFDSLLIVCDNFSGRLLHDTYLMCQTNRESMFQAMRQEINANAPTGGTSMLTLGTYLRFLDELKKYIPMTMNNSSKQLSSVICSIM